MSRLGPEHTRIQALLSAYLDGEVSTEDQSAVEEHLEGCRACTEDLRTLRQTVELLHTLPAVAPRRSFTLRHLATEERRPWWAWSFPYLRSATAAALALLLLVVSGDWAVRQLGLAPGPFAPSLSREAPGAPPEVEGEPAEAELPVEAIEAEASPEDAFAADRALEEVPSDAAAAPISEAAEAPAEVPPEGQVVGEAETTPSPPEPATPIPAVTTVVPEATSQVEVATPVPTPLPPEPEAVAPEPDTSPIFARQPVVLTLLRWTEVALVAILIPLGIGTLIAWRIRRRAA